MPGRRSARAKAAVNYAEDGLGDALPAAVKEEEEEEEEDDVPKAKSGGKKRKAAATEKASKSKSEPKKKKGKKNDLDEDESEDKPKMKSVVKKGKAPVDEHCNRASSSHVYCDDEGVVWDCMLNQTNIQNNNNKFYLIQLLQRDEDGGFGVWMRWGRVGYRGQTKFSALDLAGAKSVFTTKFQDKTKNDWNERDDFVKCPGKYDLVMMDYSNNDTNKPEDEVDGEPQVKAETVKEEPTESKLPVSVQDLISLICNVKGKRC